MLKKLFKHDMRSVSTLIFSLTLLVLGTTLVGTAASKIAVEIGNYYGTGFSVARMILQGVLGMLTGISVIAIVAFAVIVLFILMSRFYKNFFTDEGYLTFTLPVKTSSLLFSKLWTTVIWTLYDCAVVVVCMTIFITFGTSKAGTFVNTEIFTELFRVLKLVFGNLSVSIGFLILEVLVGIFVASLSGILVLFLAITIGSIIAKRHKILASIGFYYIISNIISAISTTAFFIYFVLIFDDAITSALANASVHIFIIFIILFYAAVTTVEYLLCHHFIKNKLNLS